MEEADVLLVGFGFSAIPLLREFDLSGVSYTIISEKEGSIWESLTRSGGLDLDLVRSYYTSFYTLPGRGLQRRALPDGAGVLRHASPELPADLPDRLSADIPPAATSRGDPFSDLKNKKAYRGFWQRYKEAYDRLRRPAALPSAVDG